MKRQKRTKNQIPYTVQLPGFLVEEEIGLGTLVKRTTASLGIKPCGGCEKRAAALNKFIVFKGS